METQEEAQAFLAEEGAINKLVSLGKRELQLVLEVLGQDFGPADRKSTLIQLASAAILTRSFSQDIDDEEEEEGAVGGVHEGRSVQERKRGDEVRESEQFIDNAAAQLQLLQLEFEEKDRQRQHEKWLEEQKCRERERVREEEREREKERERKEKEREKEEREREREREKERMK